MFKNQMLGYVFRVFERLGGPRPSLAEVLQNDSFPVLPFLKGVLTNRRRTSTPAHSASSTAIGVPLCSSGSSHFLKVASAGRPWACRGCSSELLGRPRPDQRPQPGAKHTLDQPAELAASEFKTRIHMYAEILFKFVEGSGRYARRTRCSRPISIRMRKRQTLGCVSWMFESRRGPRPSLAEVL